MKKLEAINDLIVISSEKYESLEVRESLVLTHLAFSHRVFVIQPAIAISGMLAGYALTPHENGMGLIQPYLPEDLSVFERKDLLKTMVEQIIQDEDIYQYSLWVDSPRAVPLIRTLCPELIIYNRKESATGRHLSELEEELKQYADVVMNNRSLSEAAFEALGVVRVWDQAIHHANGWYGQSLGDAL